MQYEDGVRYDGFKSVDCSGFVKEGVILLLKRLVFRHRFKYYEKNKKDNKG